MADPLRLHPLVADDLAAATRWYDDISTDLGNRFRQAVDSRLDAVELRPESFGRVQDELRAARVAGFPYLIVFKCHGAFTNILGVFHSAADQEKWRSRDF